MVNECGMNDELGMVEYKIKQATSRAAIAARAAASWNRMPQGAQLKNHIVDADY